MLLMESKSKQMQMTVTLIPARVSRHAGCRDKPGTHSHAYLKVRAFLCSKQGHGHLLFVFFLQHFLQVKALPCFTKICANCFHLILYECFACMNFSIQMHG